VSTSAASLRTRTALAVAILLCLAAASTDVEAQARAPKPPNFPSPTAGPGMRPTPTPLPDLRPDFVFNRVQTSTRADGTSCGIWNVTPLVVNTPTNEQYAATGVGFTIILERRTGPDWTFQEACPDCTFQIPPLGGGIMGGGPDRQFNDCGYGPPYSPDFRLRVDIHNAVKESNERNNSQVRHFPVVS